MPRHSHRNGSPHVKLYGIALWRRRPCGAPFSLWPAFQYLRSALRGQHQKKEKKKKIKERGSRLESALGHNEEKPLIRVQVPPALSKIKLSQRATSASAAPPRRWKTFARRPTAQVRTHKNNYREARRRRGRRRGLFQLIDFNAR